MKFDEMNVEQLEARAAEIRSLPIDDSVPTEELEARANELEAIQAELKAREERAAAEEALRQKVAAGNDPVTKKFEEEKTMEENRFAIESPEYRVAFLKNLQGKELTDEERTAINAAGAVIPTITMNEIIHKLELNPMIGAVDVSNIPGYVKFPYENACNEASWLPMSTASTDSADAIGYFTLGANKLIKTIEVDADVEAMSIDAFEAYLVSRLVNKIEKAIDAGIINGGGTTSGECLGILATKTTEDGTFSRGGITWAQLCAIMGKLPGQYHNGAKFVMNPEFFFQKIIGMVDSTKNRVVVLDPQGAVKYNVMGYPAILDGNLSSEEVLFGDLKAYKFNFAKAIEVRKSDEAEFRKGSQVYRAMTLADGRLGDVNAIVRYIATT
jgi:HK97 family phage major capsid protein